MHLGKKTKIVCTLGPATGNREILENLIKSGMNVARFNFSHGTWDEHKERLDIIKNLCSDNACNIASIQDLCGPKIRLGDFKSGRAVLRSGQNFILTTDEVEGDENISHVNYSMLPKEVSKGDHILLNDGLCRLEVIELNDKEVISKVLIGGEIKSRKGINIPGANLSIPALTEKDIKDLSFGIENKMDFIAISFVRKAEDVLGLRKILEEKGSNAKIIAKIETLQAINNIDEILKVSDAIMVARGDMAIETPYAEVPVVQKKLIRRAHEFSKPVIVATHMLESMVESPLPTRAEVSDIANAILDGTDAIMLSEETTIGKYPVEAVKVMADVARETEEDMAERGLIKHYDLFHNTNDSISCSAVNIAKEIKAKYIVALTHSGATARVVARHRPIQQIVALTSYQETARSLSLSYGCYPMIVPKFNTLDEAFQTVREFLIKNDLDEPGDKIVIVAGLPLGSHKETNTISVETI